jgi:hypothetical protein
MYILKLSCKNAGEYYEYNKHNLCLKINAKNEEDAWKIFLMNLEQIKLHNILS